MSWRVAAAGRRGALARIALGCVLCCLGTIASAQNGNRPKDEIFGGYAFLAPNGWGDLDYKINNIPNAFDASNTYYLRRVPNLGLIMDGSAHFLGGTTPPNLANGSNNSTAVGYVLGGLQYKFHANFASPFRHPFVARTNLFPDCCGGTQQYNGHTISVSPFVRAFLGGANISPDCCGGTRWSFAAGGGGGLDLALKPRFSIRMAQLDYIYSNYNHIFPSNHPTRWNSFRFAAGVVINIGSYGQATPPQPSPAGSARVPLDTATGAVVTSQQLRDLPLFNRNFLALGLVVASTHDVPAWSELKDTTFSISGQRPTSNAFLLDGMDNVASSRNQAIPFQVNDAIQEFRVVTATSDARFGRNIGGVVNIVTSRGTAKFHGSVFGFFASDSLDASSPLSVYNGTGFDQAAAFAGPVNAPPATNTNPNYSPIYQPNSYNQYVKTVQLLNA